MIKPSAIVIGVGAECGLGAALCRRFAQGAAAGSAEPIVTDATLEQQMFANQISRLRPEFTAGRELNMDRFTGLTVFAKVVEAANFAAAGRQLRMSPAMVSKHVQRLEEQLGVRLLNRTTRRVSATEVGQTYYEHCLRILAEMEEADGAARDLQTAPRGLLKVTAPVSFGTRQLAPAIADYLVAYPNVTIDLSLHDQYLDLLEERLDLAIRLGHLPDSSLISRKLY